MKIEIKVTNKKQEISDILLFNAWRYLDTQQRINFVCDILELRHYERLELRKLLTKFRKNIEKARKNNLINEQDDANKKSEYSFHAIDIENKNFEER